MQDGTGGSVSDVDAFFDDASSDGTCHGSGILVLGGHLRDRIYDSAEENVQKYEKFEIAKTIDFFFLFTL